MTKAIGFISSNGVEATSKINQEIIPSPPANWTMGYIVKKFSFYNHVACTIVINGISTIQLAEGRGFEVDYNDVDITSFVIKESDIPYEYIGTY